MSNLYDLAYNMEKEIQNSPDFLALKKLHEEVNADSVAKGLFDKFREKQMQLHSMQMMGQELPEAEVQAAQATFAEAEQNEKIKQLMEAEQRFAMIMNEITQIIAKPLEAIYGTPGGPQH